jgi:hypothetical protein
MVILGVMDGGTSWFFTLLLIVTLSYSDSFQVGDANKRSNPRKRPRLHIQIREWQEEDVDQIQSLLSDSSATSFDPEGSLTVDCGSSDAIQESYNEGCFLVATDDNNSSKILGTAALIVGTQVSYLKSGASISTPAVTGAVRRVCTANTRDNESILRLLLNDIQARAYTLGANELIMLAYPSTRRPNSALVEKLGYRELPTKLPGVDATQYAKKLGSATESNRANDNIATDSSEKNNSAITGIAIAALLSTFILAAFGFVGNFMGFEVLPSSATDNRGVGAPLSVEEVLRLKEDEKLKRSNIDGEQTTRQWEELGDEERREEAALMKIIQGQDVRIRPTTR